MVEFEWDDDNIGHLARHGITRDEVEDLFYRRTIRQRRRGSVPDRRMVLGRTAAGRYLAIMYQAKGGELIRPFTGWEMRPYERRLYDRQIPETD